ncbi:hypothetical protein GCM10027049_09340 [Mucilaginibacter puniceus]
MSKVLFEETQRNILLIIVPIPIAVAFGAMAAVQIISGKPIGNHPASNTALVIIFIVLVVMALVVGSQKLKTKITPDEIAYGIGIFSGETVTRFNDVKSISIRKYNPLKEFLGWGVRYNSTTDCFTMSGDDGLELTMTNNKKILIGTQKPNELQLVLETYFKDKLVLTDENKS